MKWLPVRSSLIPALFVFLWSTGFIGAKFGLPNAEPFTFVGIRMLITLAVLAIVIRVMGIHWPGDRRAYFNLAIVGLLVHGCYLGSAFYDVASLVGLCSFHGHHPAIDVYDSPRRNGEGGQSFLPCSAIDGIGDLHSVQ